MGYNYRCGKAGCRARINTHRPLESYGARKPVGVTKDGLCEQCGDGRLHEDDHNVRRHNRKQGICHCGVIPYPHRPGSADRNYGVCVEHPEFGLEQ